MKLLAVISLSCAIGAQAAIAPVAGTQRIRSDLWERDMLFEVSNEPGLSDTRIRMAVSGCAIGRGLVGMIEIDDEPMDEPLISEWGIDDDSYPLGMALAVCGSP